MRRTSHAIKVAIEIGLVLFLPFRCGAGQTARQVLDLTKQSRSGIRPMGVPGESVRGTGAEPRKSGYDLPLRLKVRQFRLSGKVIVLNLDLTNMGTLPLFIPSCLDGHKAFRPGSVGHGSLEIGVASEPPEVDRQAEPIEVTFGTSSPECSVRLEPNDTLLIITEARMPERFLNIREGTHIPIRVFVAEVKFDDDQYNVKDRSKEVDSGPVEMTF
jgi:hypothetical protein